MTDEEIVKKLHGLLRAAQELAQTPDSFLSVDMERIAAIVADKLRILDPQGWRQWEIKRYEGETSPMERERGCISKI